MGTFFDEKKLVDLDDFLLYLNKNGFNLDDGCFGTYDYTIREAAEDYIKLLTPQVKAGQTVWVVRERICGCGNEIIKCIVHHLKTTGQKWTFTCRNNDIFYCGTFTKNSISKKVFFTKEDAIKSLGDKEYKVVE